MVRMWNNMAFLAKTVFLRPGRMVFAMLFVASGIVGSPARAADINVTTTSRYYTVSGRTIHDVVRAMKWTGPYSSNDGKRALALADYRLSYRLNTKISDGSCNIHRVKVSLRIFYILPRLSSRTRLSRRDQNKWKRINHLIVAHEKQHGKFYRRLANDLQRQILKLKPKPHCARISQQARDVMRKLENRSKQRNRRYDRNQYRPFNRRLKRIRGREY